MTTVNSITDEEKELFAYIREADVSEIGLIKTNLDGKDVTVIIGVAPDGEDFMFVPLAILLNKDLFERMDDPADASAAPPKDEVNNLTKMLAETIAAEHPEAAGRLREQLDE